MLLAGGLPGGQTNVDPNGNDQKVETFSLHRDDSCQLSHGKTNAGLDYDGSTAKQSIMVAAKIAGVRAGYLTIGLG